MIVLLSILGYPLAYEHPTEHPNIVFKSEDVPVPSPSPFYLPETDAYPLPTNDETQNDASPQWYMDMFATKQTIRWKLEKLLERLPRLYSKTNMQDSEQDFDAPIFMRADDKLIPHHI